MKELAQDLFTVVFIFGSFNHLYLLFLDPPLNNIPRSPVVSDNEEEEDEQVESEGEIESV